MESLKNYFVNFLERSVESSRGMKVTGTEFVTPKVTRSIPRIVKR